MTVAGIALPSDTWINTEEGAAAANPGSVAGIEITSVSVPSATPSAVAERATIVDKAPAGRVKESGPPMSAASAVPLRTGVTFSACTRGSCVERVSCACWAGVLSDKLVAEVASDTKGRKGSATAATVVKVTLSTFHPALAVLSLWTSRQRKAMAPPAHAAGTDTRVVTKPPELPDQAGLRTNGVFAFDRMVVL